MKSRKVKPSARRGQKATDLISEMEMAELLKEKTLGRFGFFIDYAFNTPKK
jgi:hypothetical protein